MDWNEKENQNLINAFLSLETKQEAANFLRDLMTEKEITEFAKRLQTAQLLTDKVSYSTIEKITGLSSTTVARVSKWLNGTLGGYRSVLNKIHHDNSLPTGRGLS